jgi:hypothetical protein
MPYKSKKGWLGVKKGWRFTFDRMKYKRDVAFCQFRRDLHILYVISAPSDFSILAKTFNLNKVKITFLSSKFFELSKQSTYNSMSNLGEMSVYSQ